MSRYKFECYDHLGLCELKSELHDMAFEFEVVSQKLMEVYADFPIEWGDSFMFCETLKLCSKSKHNGLEHFNRLYITIEYIYPVLVLVDVDRDVLKHMLGVCSGGDDDRFELCIHTPILWLFQDRELVRCQTITLSVLSQLLIAFSRENLISRAELRSRWIHQPKQTAAALRKLP